MSAAGPGDVVVTLSNRNESKVPRFSTWAARIDVSKVDAAGTQQKGVPFRTETFEGGPTADPRWYEQQAATLRNKAEEMRRMAEEYAKPDYLPSPKQTKEELIAHCQLFIKLYIETAQEAETLTKLHRDLEKTIP